MIQKYQIIQNCDLTKLGNKYNTDKTWHKKNTEIYSEIFKHFSLNRDDKMNILELGISNGNSHLMWHEYFKNSNIIGLDLWDVSTYYEHRFIDGKEHYKSFEENGEKIDKLSHIKRLLSENNRLDFYIGEQADVKVLAKIVDKYKSFDFIMDDCSHKDQDIKDSFNYLFPYLKKGGIYIIEDLGTGTPNVVNAIASYRDKLTYFNHFDDIKFANLIFSKDYVDVDPKFSFAVIGK